jgi:hypothetical protein
MLFTMVKILPLKECSIESNTRGNRELVRDVKVQSRPSGYEFLFLNDPSKLYTVESLRNAGLQDSTQSVLLFFFDLIPFHIHSPTATLARVTLASQCGI